MTSSRWIDGLSSQRVRGRNRSCVENSEVKARLADILRGDYSTIRKTLKQFSSTQKIVVMEDRSMIGLAIEATPSRWLLAKDVCKVVRGKWSFGVHLPSISSCTSAGWVLSRIYRHWCNCWYWTFPRPVRAYRFIPEPFAIQEILNWNGHLLKRQFKS